MEIIDGVKVVNNPKEPVYQEDILSLEEELTIRDLEGTEGFLFTMLTSIDVDSEGCIYVADQQAGQVHVFDNRGKFLRSFGERGQGPGEMNLPFSLSVTPQREILVNDWMLRRISYFTPEGKFIGLHATATHLFLRTTVDSERNLVGSYLIPGENPQVVLEKFTPELESLLKIDSSSMPRPPEMSAFIPHFFWKVVQNNHILWGNINKYEFFLTDSSGQLIQKIVKDYDPVRTSQKARENWQEEINWDYIPPFVNAQVKLPDVYPPFLTFSVDERGRIITRTFEKDGEGNSLYDIFDLEGRYAAKVSPWISPLDPRRHIWKNERLYTIETDDNETQLIRIYKVRWKKI